MLFDKLSHMNVLNTLNKIVFGVIFLVITAAAAAGPAITVEVIAEKEIVIEQNGKPVRKRIIADNIQPGEIIIYTLKYSNSGDSAARDIVINDPIPEKTRYIAGSAKGRHVVFSIDGGKHYLKPSLLTYTYQGKGGIEEKKVASPDEYTHIRWVIDEIDAGKSGTVEFQVQVE